MSLPLLSALAACESSEPAVVDHPAIRAGTLLANPTAELPERLSDVGLYPRLPALTVPEGVHDYAPAWPLWTNGSDKHRHAFVPGAVDATDRVRWAYPVGTMFFKTFAYVRADGTRQLVETRVLRRTAEGWQYASYQWNDAGTDATLLDLRLGVPVAVTNAEGESFSHRIPNRTECRTCHEASPSPVLGFSELQLADAHDDAHGSELERFSSLGVLANAPSSPSHLAAADERTRDVLAYFQGNCVHCHNGSAVAPALLDLRPEVAVAQTVGVRTQSSATASGLRIEAGHPERSVLFLAVSGEGDDEEIKPMPPLGVELVDARSIERLREWIGDLR